MSNNYEEYNITGMIDCQTFKECYQVCRQLKRHGFEKVYEMTIDNTRILSYVKNKTGINVYIYNEIQDQLTGRKVSYIDYINRLVKRYTDHYRKAVKQHLSNKERWFTI